jgi:Glycosyl hydrolases family 28
MMARVLQVVVFCVASLLPVAGYAQRANSAIPAVCDITRFGAIANDANLDDLAIARAIGQCAQRGGQVLVPAGVFLTGGVELKSNMELHLAGGAILRGAPSLAQYRLLPTNDNDRKRGLVVGINVTNVAITGHGTIDGAGAPFHTPNAERPDFSLGLFGCSNISVRNITLIDPAKYHVTANTCSNIVFDGVTILADMLAPNSDGLQLRDTSDVRISNCRIETGDDAIVLKSGNRMIERISISNCALKSDDAAFKFGTGSEPGIRHVNVSNVTITGSRYGIALFMQDGGLYEDNRFSNMIIETGGRHAREYPIFVDIDTRQPDSPAGWGRIRGLSFDGIDIKTRGNILIQGQPGHDVEELRLSDISIRVENGVDLTTVNGKPRGNRAHAPRTGAADYSSQSGQIVIGHARHVTISNVSVIGVTAADQRPVLVIRDAKQLRVDGQAIAASEP